MKRSAHQWKRLTLCIGVALSLLLGCFSTPPQRLANARPVVVIGIDGLDWKVLLPLMKAGRLPNLSSVAASGFAGRLATLRPTLSPAIWTTIATGVLPPGHGIRGFVRNRPSGAVLFSSLDRRVKALWDIADDAGLRSVVVGWWNTFPAEAIDGVMVSQVNTPPQARADAPHPNKGGPVPGLLGQVHPAERQGDLLNLARQVDAELGTLEKDFTNDADFSISPIAAKLWSQTRWSLRADASYTAIAEHVLGESSDYALAMIYLGLPDVVSHRFWRWAYPQEYDAQPSPEELEEFSSFVDLAYEKADQALGRILDKLPQDALVVILSDHGMQTVNRRARFDDPSLPAKQLISAAHPTAPPGVLIVAGPGLAQPTPFTIGSFSHPAELPILGKVQDIAPTLLALMGQPIGDDMPGRVLRDLIDPEFLMTHPLKSIPTHTASHWRSEGRTIAGSADDEEERLQQLRDLGYTD